MCSYSLKCRSCVASHLQCADLGQLIEQNKNSMSTGYDSASKVWTGVEIVAQLELLGLTAALFTELRVQRCCMYSADIELYVVIITSVKQ